MPGNGRKHCYKCYRQQHRRRAPTVGIAGCVEVGGDAFRKTCRPEKCAIRYPELNGQGCQGHSFKKLAHRDLSEDRLYGNNTPFSAPALSKRYTLSGDLDSLRALSLDLLPEVCTCDVDRNAHFGQTRAHSVANAIAKGELACGPFRLVFFSSARWSIGVVGGNDRS